ncbi:hypothetical protein OWR29_14590 [Actinoplanes sp. Pm04-4]|uniref:Uncharacterized protein n=1 Tax=Paractinoplanes pyxinae TaxID=2997416 RepID=A0ABT4AYA2_9ACTN|nr:hypothetical protein [Actinoplanes pyxinae]MCY1139224.1 hypothetical protein [Actinoplanes pyxinae]
MDQIPRDIELAVRAAAEDSKGYAGELPGVYRRARRRARRRVTAVASAFVVLAGLVGGGLVVRQRQAAYEPAVAPPAPAQRLILSGVAGEYEAPQNLPTPVRLGGNLQIGEVSADDHLITHSVVGGGSYDRSIGLPDGRLVSLGPRSGGAMLLTVQSLGGETQQRDIRQMAEPVALAAADAATAYLWRPHGLYAHDLAGGLERLVISSAMLDVSEADPGAALDAADVVGDRLIIAGKSRSCRPLLLGIDPPGGVRFLPLTSLGCSRVTDLRLSPSTNRLAVTYTKAAGGVRVAVLSTEDGAILADREVATASTCQVRIAWLNERVVRGVTVPPRSPEPQELSLFRIPT